MTELKPYVIVEYPLDENPWLKRALEDGKLGPHAGFTPKQIYDFLHDQKSDAKTLQEYYGKPPIDPYTWRDVVLNVDTSYGAGIEQPVQITSEEQFLQVYGSTIMTDNFREPPTDPIFAPYMNDVVKVSNCHGMNTYSVSIFQDWITDLPFMQQAVIASGIRAMDGWEKLHQAKHLMRWVRRATMISSFEGVPLDTPYGDGGGSFTGSAPENMTLSMMADLFLESRDAMSMHFYMHMMHAIQIIGYKHSTPGIRGYFYYVYKRMVNVMHCEPESQEAMDLRLCDNEATWRARMDENSISCSD